MPDNDQYPSQMNTEEVGQRRFDEVAGENLMAGWQVAVRRLDPYHWPDERGSCLILGEIARWPVERIERLRQKIIDAFGGGKYKLVLHDPCGNIIRTAEISVSTDSIAPKGFVQDIPKIPTGHQWGCGYTVMERVAGQLKPEPVTCPVCRQVFKSQMAFYGHCRTCGPRVKLPPPFPSNGPEQKDVSRTEPHILEKLLEQNSILVKALTEANERLAEIVQELILRHEGESEHNETMQALARQREQVEADQERVQAELDKLGADVKKQRKG